jgi:uncharacterized protein YjbJ (UPF0337 family)
MNEDELKGVTQDAGGKIKDAAGGLTGDTGLQAEGKLDQAAGKIQGQYGTAKEQLGSAADAIAEKVSDFANRAGSTMSDAAQTVRREAGHAGEKVYDAGSRAGEYAGRTVKEQPLLSLIGVAAIGYAIGFLIHSPTSRWQPGQRQDAISEEGRPPAAVPTTRLAPSPASAIIRWPRRGQRLQ